LTESLSRYWKRCYEEGHQKHSGFYQGSAPEQSERNQPAVFRSPAVLRDGAEIYDEKSDRQTLWRAFLKKGYIQHAPEKLATTAKEIEEFLVKPLHAVNKNQEFKEEWKAPGPWR
jgi:hypothetical protein